MKIEKFEDLNIWRLSMEITQKIYGVVSQGDFSRDFELKGQLRRAIISVSSNIAEGFEKGNNKEFMRYLRIAKGSVGEARNQIYIAFNVGYINKEVFVDLNVALLSLTRQISSLIGYLVKQKKLGKF
jgi:four helix bundle protein